MTVKGPPFWGKYRGTVTKNNDDLGRGRIKVKVPDVLGDLETGWCEPAFPYAGPQVGFFFLPPERAMVWIEFEHGDPERPIWTGCFLREGSADLPLPVRVVPDKKIIKTAAWTITIDDTSGSAKLTIESGGASPTQRVAIEQNKITIANGQSPLATVVLEGAKVSINGTALEVQ